MSMFSRSVWRKTRLGKKFTRFGRGKMLWARYYTTLIIVNEMVWSVGSNGCYRLWDDERLADSNALWHISGADRQTPCPSEVSDDH